MENLAELLKELAVQLGTTSEYLWSVLIAQAHIQVITHIYVTVIVLLTAGILFLVHRKLMKPIKEDDRSWNKYDDIEVLAPIMGVLGVICLGAVIGVAFGIIPELITAIFNPEYWALQEILKQL